MINNYKINHFVTYTDNDEAGHTVSKDNYFHLHFYGIWLMPLSRATYCIFNSLYIIAVELRLQTSSSNNTNNRNIKLGQGRKLWNSLSAKLTDTQEKKAKG